MKASKYSIKVRLAFCFAAMLVWLQASAVSVEQADSAYLAGNFDDALVIYEEVLASQGVSAGLLYNMGNTYYKLGKDANAMLCYERALKLEPGNRAVRQNLDFLTSRVNDANKASHGDVAGSITPDDETFVDRIYRMIATDRTSNSWAVFAVMAFILFLGALAMYIFTPNVLARKTGFFSGFVFLGFTVIFLVFAFMAASDYNRTDRGVLMSFTTELHEDASDASKALSTPLHAGTRLKVLEEKKGADGSEWLKVKLNSDNIGWIKKNELEII